MKFASIFSDDYLISSWASEYQAYKTNGGDADLLGRLRNWDQRDPKLTETQTESAFARVFFEELWGYWPTGTTEAAHGFCMVSQSKVAGAGQGGGMGAADLALGWYGRAGVAAVDQVLCEFKDVGSGLDAPQRRKGNTRSPVKQCFDYLRYAFDQTPTNSSVRPTWGIVTDMNEFRLYGRRLGEGQVQRFVLRTRPADPNISLLEDSEAGRQQRFLFSRILHRQFLLTESGTNPLERILDSQGLQEKALEEEFYREYSAYREYLFNELVIANPQCAGTKWRLVRMAQRLLDRLLFIMFAEDMGGALRFPRDLLRDTLAEHSRLRSYNPDDQKVWGDIRALFRSMAEGVPFGKSEIPRFNGGLFQEDPELESLSVPTKVFCVAGQGESPSTMLQHPKTLLSFCAKYNFGATGAQQQRTIGLYALGRIFEQSLTDLEVLEAHAAGRESLAEITKRKRDGVYYTPEWVTAYIVQETVGRRLDDIKEEVRRELELEENFAVTNDDVAKWRAAPASKRKDGTPRRVELYRAFLDKYVKRLEVFTVVDPACGSGAFLIQALELLLRERRWVAEERSRVEGQFIFDQDALIRETLSKNIFGVDINSESVEITKLAMWLHTALPGKPLCALDDNIRCGNSLVGPEFDPWYRKKRGLLFASLDEGVQAKVNVFDWRAAFPKVFESGGFDAVVGNPPYVKLQHFRRVEADVAEFLTEARRADGTPVYRSTQTGNFDLYLPFIEKGIGLLKPDGRMGFIAPSLWLVNNYGEELRKLVKERQNIVKWVDFGDFQVFEEAMTYTAIQLYSFRASEGFELLDASSGDVAGASLHRIEFAGLPQEGAWHVGTGSATALLHKLRGACIPLEACVPGGVVGFRGIESGADEFYHFRRLGPGRYEGIKSGARVDMRGVAVELDDSIMRPLVSSGDARRFEAPSVDIYAIFPFIIEKGKARLLSQIELEANCPKAWSWFRANESHLRARDNRSMDRDDGWWGYTRPMNLERQDHIKLGVPQTVQRLQAFFDSKGAFCFNNVRVGGIEVHSEGDGWFLLGILNSEVPDWCFRQAARKKAGGYFEANKQFIAPLPIPHATDDQKAEVGARARRLQELHSKRRDVVAALDQRLLSAQTEADPRAETWFWADLKDWKHWVKSAPPGLSGREASAWAKAHYHVLVDNKLASLSALIEPGSAITADEKTGELTVRSHVHILLQGYENEAEAPFVAAQWRHVLRDLRIKEGFEAAKLLRLLLNLRRTDNVALRDQVVKLDQEIQRLDAEIATAEAEMNEIIYGLYGLTEEERKVVEGGEPGRR